MLVIPKKKLDFTSLFSIIPSPRSRTGIAFNAHLKQLFRSYLYLQNIFACIHTITAIRGSGTWVVIISVLGSRITKHLLDDNDLHSSSLGKKEKEKIAD